MEYTEEDNVNISIAFEEGGDIWSNNKVEDIKIRLKQFFREQSEQCCYCKKDFSDEFNMVIDIEHILPKKKYEDYTFEIFNLNIACKRCNMRIKKDNTDFITDINSIVDNRLDTNYYKFIHPNFDVYFDHLEVVQVIRNDKKLIKYLVLDDSPKGYYTFEYFQLEKRQIDTINEAQGIKVIDSEISELIPEEIVIDFKNLLSRI